MQGEPYEIWNSRFVNNTVFLPFPLPYYKHVRRFGHLLRKGLETSQIMFL